MKITSNYNLSFNQKVNKQQSKTNPNFGINAKNLTLPLGIGAGAIYGAVHKLMPVPPPEIFLAMQNKPVSENKDSGLTSLPADWQGYTRLHYLCIDGKFDAVKKFLTEHPNINLSQMSNSCDTYMSLAIDNKQEDIINLIAGMDNYNPEIPDKYGVTDLHYLCKHGYTDVVKTLLEKHPEIDFNQQTVSGSTCMSLAIGKEQKDIINLIAGLDKYNPAILNKDGWTDLHYLCENGYTDVVKTLLEKHPEIDFSQQAKELYSCMFLAINNEYKDLINLIADRDNYNPAIPNKKGWTDLHFLCRHGYTDVVKTLMEKHPDIDFNQQINNDSSTCLTLAVNYGHEDIINLIAGKDNYNPALPDKDGWTDLHSLCEKGYTDVVKTLMEKHPEIDFNQQTEDGDTCMYLAIDNEQEDIINLIAGTDKYNPTIPDKNGRTDLHSLCEKGYTDVVKTLLEKHPDINFNQQTKNGDTCMSLAIKNNHEDIINLIANTDKFNPAISNEYDWTDLHRLFEKGYTDVVKTILEKHPKIDINQQTKNGDTCMSLAIKNKQEDIINLIAGLDNYNPNHFTSYGYTDLHELCERGYTDAVKTILEKHPEIDINKKTENGSTCMSFAILYKHEDIINLIAGLDNYNPTIPDEDGWTDLHYLCKKGYTDAVKTLMEKHPDFDINQKTKDGKTCMSLAIENGRRDIINLIAGKDNYDPTIPDKDGWTDLHYLCKYRYTDAVKTLMEKHPDIDFSQQTEDGDTCMSLALNYWREIINLIAGKDNYNPTIPNKDGWTDLHYLCGDGYTDIVKTLLEKHPDIDFSQQTEDGDTCMSLAIDNNQEDIINLIAGMDNYRPDIPDKDGWTDLHCLLNSNCTEAVKTILKNKPDLNINQFTNNGYSCMTMAIANGNKDLVNLIAGLKNYNPLIINKFGANDLHYLCRAGYTEAVKTILDNNPDIDLNQLTTGGYSYIDLAKLNNHKDTVKIISDKISDSKQAG